MHHQELMVVEFKIFNPKARSNFDYVHAINFKYKEVQEHLQYPKPKIGLEEFGVLVEFWFVPCRFLLNPQATQVFSF